MEMRNHGKKETRNHGNVKTCFIFAIKIDNWKRPDFKTPRLEAFEFKKQSGTEVVLFFLKQNIGIGFRNQVNILHIWDRFFIKWSSLLSFAEKDWDRVPLSGFYTPVVVLFNCLDMTPVIEKAMAPHPSTLAWKIPWMEEPGGLQSIGSQRVRHE